MKPFSSLLAVAVILATASAATCETVVYQTTCQPETRTWVSGHYEWVGDTWGYVPGHWVVRPARCQTTEIDACGDTVVYVDRPTEHVICVDPPPCERRTVVVAPACPPPVVVRERRCEPPPCERRSRVDVIPVPVPLPLPDPFLFLHRHHH